MVMLCHIGSRSHHRWFSQTVWVPGAQPDWACCTRHALQDLPVTCIHTISCTSGVPTAPCAHTHTHGHTHGHTPHMLVCMQVRPSWYLLVVLVLRLSTAPLLRPPARARAPGSALQATRAVAGEYKTGICRQARQLLSSAACRPANTGAYYCMPCAAGSSRQESWYPIRDHSGSCPKGTLTAATLCADPMHQLTTDRELLPCCPAWCTHTTMLLHAGC